MESGGVAGAVPCVAAEEGVGRRDMISLNGSQPESERGTERERWSDPERERLQETPDSIVRRCYPLRALK